MYQVFWPNISAYLANDLGERSSLVLGDDHGWDQQGPFGPAWKLFAQTQDVLKHRGGATLLNSEVLGASSAFFISCASTTSPQNYRLASCQQST